MLYWLFVSEVISVKDKPVQPLDFHRVPATDFQLKICSLNVQLMVFFNYLTIFRWTDPVWSALVLWWKAVIDTHYLAWFLWIYQKVVCLVWPYLHFLFIPVIKSNHISLFLGNWQLTSNTICIQASKMLNQTIQDKRGLEPTLLCKSLSKWTNAPQEKCYFL